MYINTTRIVAIITSGNTHCTTMKVIDNSKHKHTYIPKGMVIGASSNIAKKILSIKIG